MNTMAFVEDMFVCLYSRQMRYVIPLFALYVDMMQLFCRAAT
jgi:hypothetical protein